ncbi:hypothetical protein BHE74_00022648 [Ensete ventricosum]|nr:hypothetical protein BHE74_00022648 [Ensete ventricosum]
MLNGLAQAITEPRVYHLLTGLTRSFTERDERLWRTLVLYPPVPHCESPSQLSYTYFAARPADPSTAAAASSPVVMAATVIESFAVPCRSRASAPRASASVSSLLCRRGLGLLPQFSGLRCASVPLKVKLAAVSARSRVVRRGAVVCDVQETAVQRNSTPNFYVPDVTKATWQSLVLDSSVPVLVDFWAPWCGPCRMIEPTVAKLAKVYGGKLKCYKLNTDENPDIATQYGIRSIPTMMIFKNGEKKDTVIGAVPESTLVTSIEKFV